MHVGTGKKKIRSCGVASQIKKRVLFNHSKAHSRIKNEIEEIR